MQNVGFTCPTATKYHLVIGTSQKRFQNIDCHKAIGESIETSFGPTRYHHECFV
jgi:hypothetical protein